MTYRFPDMAGEAVKIPGPGLDRDEAHLFAKDEVNALTAAMASERPLLLRGEPGVGKTQLAKAAAIALKRGFVSLVVDSSTEVRDLRWREDLVRRLAEAQMAGVNSSGSSVPQARDALALREFIEPGPLWWGFDWRGAARLRSAVHPLPLSDDCHPRNGVVVLIDEIDKAEADLPNGLLEALGAKRFQPPGPAVVEAVEWPLVILTTNEERQLPAAFLRRCVVHEMTLPDEREAFEDLLLQRGSVHFPEADLALLERAAGMTWEDREAAGGQWGRQRPGQAEYMDLIRALMRLGRTPEERAQDLEDLSGFFLQKHTGR